MTKYPLHEKLAGLKVECRVLGDFLDWLDECGITLCERADTAQGEYVADWVSKEARIGAFLGIDPRGLDREKDAMVEELRKDS